MPESTQAALIWRAEHLNTTDPIGAETTARFGVALIGLVRRAPRLVRRTAAAQPAARIQAAN